MASQPWESKRPITFELRTSDVGHILTQKKWEPNHADHALRGWRINLGHPYPWLARRGLHDVARLLTGFRGAVES